MMALFESLQSVPVIGILFALLFVIITSFANGWKEKREGRREAEAEHEREQAHARDAANQTTGKIIKKETENAAAALEAGHRAHRAKPNAVERMSDAEFALTFGRPRAPGDPGYRH